MSPKTRSLPNFLRYHALQTTRPINAVASPPISWSTVRAELPLYVAAALAAAVVTWGLQQIFVSRADRQFQERMDRLALHLSNGSTKQQVLGAVTMLGGLDAVARATAEGALPPDNTQILNHLQQLDNRFQLSNALVQNREGVVVAYYIVGGKSGTGRDLSFRPYFRAAMTGQANMYAALGSNTGERGFYIAAPVYPQDPPSAATETDAAPRPVGTIVAKLDFKEVDTLIEAEADPLVVVSPEGIVFASNIEAWRFNLVGDSGDAVEQALRGNRVGKAFDNAPPPHLPVDAQGWTEVKGERLKQAFATIHWSDPGGDWTLMGFASPTRNFNAWAQALTALLVFGFVVLLGQWRRARTEGRRRAAQVRNLLDNSGEGFLTITTDLHCGAEYSRACVDMLGQAPALQRASTLFFGSDAQKATLFDETIAAAQAQTDPDTQSSMLSLLPAEMARGAVLLKAEYKMLDSGRVMVVLKDISEERRMSALLDGERRRMEMILLAITDSRNFFDTVDSLREFLSGGLARQLATDQPPAQTARALYRQIHTFKGLLNQFSFAGTPALLHSIESQLAALCQQGDALALAPLAALVQAAPLQAAFDADLALINAALGDDFLARGESVVLTETQARQLEALAAQLLRGEPVDTSLADIRALLHSIRALRRVPLKDVLAGFNGVVQKAAARLDKQVAPLAIQCSGEIAIDPTVYQPFLRALVHVFTNAVAHGIETPEARWEVEKDETGQISCHIAARGGQVQLVIADDGAGIALDRLRARAVESGICSADEVAAMDDGEAAQLIFRDQLSTRQEANELAGRGVGLAVVLAETYQLGGTLRVRSVPGVGTEFHFTLPLAEAGL